MTEAPTAAQIAGMLSPAAIKRILGEEDGNCAFTAWNTRTLSQADGRREVEPTEAMVDRAAQHLRETQQAGKMLTPWDRTPKATKRKWVELAWGTLRAALTEVHREKSDG